MEQVKGFEPSLSAWKADVLTINTTPAFGARRGFEPPLLWYLLEDSRSLNKLINHNTSDVPNISSSYSRVHLNPLSVRAIWLPLKDSNLHLLNQNQLFYH